MVLPENQFGVLLPYENDEKAIKPYKKYILRKRVTQINNSQWQAYHAPLHKTSEVQIQQYQLSEKALRQPMFCHHTIPTSNKMKWLDEIQDINN